MKQRMAREVSFYIPVRNAAKTLEAAIESVRSQTVAPATFFLVVDVRSTDDTERIARASGVQVIEQTQARLGHARNMAFSVCKTPWLACCDADVTLEPAWLERLLPRLDDSVAAVGGCTLEALRTDADRWRAVNMPHNWGPAPLDNPFMLVSEMVARVEAVQSVGGYRPELYYYEDSDLCQRLRHAGYHLRYEPGARAHHHRGDSVLDVLNLRWVYAFHRQRTLLENLPGLQQKLAVNRNYALQSLSQTLHSEHPEVCAISLLLWFHHVRRDLRAALDHWPLLGNDQRTACVGRVNAVFESCLTGPWRGLLLPLEQLLPSEVCEPPASVKTSLARTAGFSDYVSAVERGTRGLLEEIPAELVPTLVSSAERLMGFEEVEVPSPTLAVTEGARASLERQLLQPAWQWRALLDELRAMDLGEQTLQAPTCVGTVLDEEQPAGNEFDRVRSDSGQWTLLPHLETYADPQAALREGLRGVGLAVIAYQTPTVFVPAVPLLTARDLAGLCATSGFAIRHFHAEAGRTRLVVVRDDGSRVGKRVHREVAAHGAGAR